ncbi:MAG TPA: HAMP domain-containing protein, partial [Anaerolineae bacterium]|nr:HAMP domain-containing protein [Anaerolineae bacterium]
MKARLQRWWALIWRLVGGVSVRVKIMGIALGLVVLLGLGLTWQVRTTMTRALTAELEQRGISIARDLAARSTDLVLTNNLFALYELVQDTVANDQDVRYAFILSPEGKVLAHSFGRGFPPDLVTANVVRSNQHHQLEILDTEEGLIRDVAVPVFRGQAGVARVGMSEQGLRQTLDAVTRRLLLTTLLASLGGVAASTVLTWVLTRPVLRLVDATRAVARGDLSHKVTPWAEDEIGQLEASFNAMVDDLARARQQTEAYNRRLLRRNRELSALNAVAQAVSGPLSLGEALERALEQVLSVVDSDAGWICLLGEDGACRAFAGMRNLCRSQARSELNPCLRHCACRQALETGRPVLVPSLRADCPLLDVEMEGSRPIVGHVAVPLLVKAQVVGLLNVVCHEESCFEPDDLDLLNAVGQQLGVAIENTRL